MEIRTPGLRIRVHPVSCRLQLSWSVRWMDRDFDPLPGKRYTVACNHRPRPHVRRSVKIRGRHMGVRRLADPCFRLHYDRKNRHTILLDADRRSAVIVLAGDLAANFEMTELRFFRNVPFRFPSAITRKFSGPLSYHAILVTLRDAPIDNGLRRDGEAGGSDIAHDSFHFHHLSWPVEIAISNDFGMRFLR